MRPIGWQVVESAGDEKAIVPRTVRLSTRRSTSAHREEFSRSEGVATLTRIVPSREPLGGEETAMPAMRLRGGGGAVGGGGDGDAGDAAAGGGGPAGQEVVRDLVRGTGRHAVDGKGS